jgi:hypothetical protein
LNPQARRTLLAYRQYRQALPSFGGLLKRSLPRLLFLLVVAGLGFVIFRELGFFLVGMIVGAALRQASLVWQSHRALPMVLEALDWEKVDHLLAGHGDSPPSHGQVAQS